MEARLGRTEWEMSARQPAGIKMTFVTLPPPSSISVMKRRPWSPGAPPAWSPPPRHLSAVLNPPARINNISQILLFVTRHSGNSLSRAARKVPIVFGIGEFRGPFPCRFREFQTVLTF